MLADLVRAGRLPPVEARLPPDPVVVDPVREIGRYGGTWRRMAIQPEDSLMATRLGYEPLVRWDRTGRTIAPGVAERWEVSDQGRTYTFHLRPGMRWSDGEPFTSEAFTFWYEDVFGCRDMLPALVGQLAPDDNRFQLTAPNERTVVFRFDRPNGIFLELLAFRGHYIYAPKHYLKQFHVRHAAPETLARLAKAYGFHRWHELFLAKYDLHANPDLPTIRPWKIEIPPPSTRVICVRNPYYWKVDPAGNQLPYIDRIAFTVVQNTEVLNLKAMTGEVDMQERYIDSGKFTLFMENHRLGGYHVLADPSPNTTCIFLNQHSKDPAMRSLLQDRRFRLALSAAVNRAEIIQLAQGGLGTPANAVSNAFDPYWTPEIGGRNIAYDPDTANLLLDAVGLSRGTDGMRRMPDGRPFHQIIHCASGQGAGGLETWELVWEHWREAGLAFTVKPESLTLARLRVMNGGCDFYATSQPGLHWVADPAAFVPLREDSYCAPLYGRYQMRKGRSGVPPSPEFQRLIDTYRLLTATVGDSETKLDLGRLILSQWAEECYVIGIAQRMDLTIVSNRFHNVPDRLIHDYRLMMPGYVNPEQFFLAAETP